MSKKRKEGIDWLEDTIKESSNRLQMYKKAIKVLEDKINSLEMEKAMMLKKGFIGPGGNTLEGTLRLHWSAPEEGAYIKELPVFCHECGTGVYHPNLTDKCCEWKCDKCGHVHGTANSWEEICTYVSYDLDKNVMLEKAAADTIKEIVDGKVTEERALSCTVFRHQWEKPWFDDITKKSWGLSGYTLETMNIKVSEMMNKLSEKELNDFFVGNSRE